MGLDGQPDDQSGLDGGTTVFLVFFHFDAGEVVEFTGDFGDRFFSGLSNELAVPGAEVRIVRQVAAPGVLALTALGLGACRRRRPD